MNRQFGKLLLPLAFTLLAVSGISGCLEVDNPFTGLPPGPWRAVLDLSPQPIASNPQGKPLPDNGNFGFQEVTEGELPFNFEIKYENEKDYYIEITNGAEHIRVDDIFVGRDRSTAKDTVVISFPVYDSYIRAIFEEGVMEGEWVLNNKPDYRVHFVARHGQNHRFTTLRKPPVMDLSGRWEATFGIGSEEEYKAIAEFQQQGNHLLGTFLTETGDYRYLEGTVQANKLYLSTFDGAHAFLFEGKIQEDGTLIGSFQSGKHYKTIWEARRNPDFQLRNAYEVTYLREGYDKLQFAFENTEGQLVSLESPPYKDKVVLVQIMGTWCPNCRDETEFLKDYLKQHPGQEIEVLALAFERYQNPDKAKRAIKTFKEKMEVPYEILYAGIAGQEEASKALPMLNAIISYPTLVFIGRDGKVKKIHTGFTGPATSEFETFKQEFETYVNQLLNEKQ